MVLGSLVYIAMVIIVIIVIIILLRFLFGVLFIIPSSILDPVNMLLLPDPFLHPNQILGFSQTYQMAHCLMIAFSEKEHKTYLSDLTTLKTKTNYNFTSISMIVCVQDWLYIVTSEWKLNKNIAVAPVIYSSNVIYCDKNILYINSMCH